MLVGMTTSPPGVWLRAKLDERGLTPHDVVARTDVKTTQAVYQWMNGKSSPGDEVAAQLAELLDVPELEVRYRFGLYISRRVVEEAQWRREVERFAELVAEEEQFRRDRRGNS